MKRPLLCPIAALSVGLPAPAASAHSIAYDAKPGRGGGKHLEGFRLVVWAFELPIPLKMDVRHVDPFVPSDHSLKGSRRGLRPKDHALGKTLRAGDPALAQPKK